MARRQPYTLSSNERKELLDSLWTMIALLESRDEVKNFFKDLLSETEAIMIARRIKIALLLLNGIGYDEIESRVRCSPTTIASVHRWLQSGFGGYSVSLPKLEKEFTRRRAVEEEREEERTPLSAAWMRAKYPLHYLLVNMLGKEVDLTPPKKLRRKQ